MLAGPAAEQRYQLGFSDDHAGEMYDSRGRAQKAARVLAVLEDYLGKDLSGLSLLDVGSSTGFFTDTYARRFGRVVGVDIDATAVSFASSSSRNAARYVLSDSINLAIADNKFDVVTCTHVYEHVPDPLGLVREIHRVLKPGGVCYFAAGNRLVLLEGHYHLPLLSVVPKSLADLYLRLLRRGKEYYETHLTYWQLKGLVTQFEVTDYTMRIIEEPERFSATDVLRAGTLKHRVARAVANRAVWLLPTYHWLLQKDPRAQL